MRSGGLAWLQLALREFRKAFGNFTSSAVPGGRDLFGISAVSGLLVAVIAMMTALHQGVVINFADSLLGYAPGAGVPLRVSANTALGARINEVMVQFANGQQLTGKVHADTGSALARYGFHPIEEIETPSRRLSLPQPERSWRAAITGQDNLSFVGWGTALKSPLWKWAAVQGSEADQVRTVVLSRVVFRQRFDLDAYIDAIRQILPLPVAERWRQAQSGPDQLKTLFLLVPSGSSEPQLSEFRVAWVDSFPALQRIAFMMPLETYRAIDLAASNLNARFTGSLGKPSAKRIQVVRIFGATDLPGYSAPDGPIEKLRKCLVNTETMEDHGPSDVYLRLPLALPDVWVDECLTRANIQDRKDVDLEPTEITGIEMRADAVSIACADLNRDATNELAGCSKGAAKVDLSPFRNIAMGLVYAPDRRELATVRDAVMEARVGGLQAFFLSELYQNSLIRFSYLVKTLDFMILPIALFGMFVVLYVINFQITTWISHRRKHYGILLARGLYWYEVYLMCACQVFLATLAGLAFAVVLVEAAKLGFNHLFANSEAADLARNQLGIRDPNLVSSLSWESLDAIRKSAALALASHGIAAGVILAANLLLLFRILWTLPLRPRTTPIELIGSG